MASFDPGMGCSLEYSGDSLRVGSDKDGEGLGNSGVCFAEPGNYGFEGNLVVWVDNYTPFGLNPLVWVFWGLLFPDLLFGFSSVLLIFYFHSNNIGNNSDDKTFCMSRFCDNNSNIR
jgi:hypothetical protein